MDDMRAKVIDLDLNDVLPNRFQPRIKFSEDSIIELSESIKEHGVIQPIIVRPIGDKYEIIAGERRYKASVLAGKDTIPAIISDIKDKECAEIALIENVQRKDLTAIEEAISYKKILDMGYLTQEQLAVRLGKSQSAVANKIRLLNLCDEVQEALMEEKISERHARSLLKIKESSKQKEMLERIIDERLTVRKTEEEIEKMNNYISEPMNDMSMNNNQGGFSTVNPGLAANNQPQNTNSSVDFSALLMSESAKSTNGMNNSSSSAGYQFDANGVVTGEPTSMNPSPAMPQTGYQFDANGMVVNEPQVPSMTPTSVAPQTSFQFDTNGGVVGENSNTSMSAMPTTPIIENTTIASESMMNTSSENSTFGLNVPETPVAPEVMPSSEPEEKPFSFNDLLATNSQREAQHNNSMMTDFGNSPEVPTNPIASQQLPDTFLDTTKRNDFGLSEGNNENMQMSQMATPRDPATGDSLKEEKVDIQPIIITDYSKQYDPVLPPSQQPVERIDFKQIISLIRDVNDTIEKCGYTVETEEVDLENEYQVIFKINKN